MCFMPYMDNIVKAIIGLILMCLCCEAQMHKHWLIAPRPSGGAAPFNWESPVIRYEIDQGLPALSDGDLITTWTNQGTWPITGVTGTPGPRWFTSYVESTNLAFASFPGGYIAKQPVTVMMVTKIIRDIATGTPGIFGINGAMIGMGTGWTFNGWVDIYAGAHLDTGGTVFTNNDAFFLMTVIFNGANSKIRVNGLEKASGNAGTSDIGNVTYTGAVGYMGYNANSFVNAQFKRFVVWTNAISLETVTNAERLCMTNFSLP